MTSSTVRRCELRFPAAGVLLDNSAIVRLHKCEALDVLAGTVRLHVAGQVAKEFHAQGPAERATLAGLGVEIHRVRPGGAAWSAFCTLRGGRFATRDLGEDESIAVALAEAERGELLPFVTYDRLATSRSGGAGVVTLDFLDTLAWLVGCGVVTAQQADEIESLASVVDGWRRPAGYAGTIESVRETRQRAVVERVLAWRARAK
jgi:hypothetical protein